MNEWLRRRLLSEPGEFFSYRNVGCAVLGRLVGSLGLTNVATHCAEYPAYQVARGHLPDEGLADRMTPDSDALSAVQEPHTALRLMSSDDHFGRAAVCW